MAKSIYQKLALVTVGAVLSLAAIENPSAQAAMITYDFTVNITSGDLQGNSYTGFFSYDDSNPSGYAAAAPLLPYFAPSDFKFNFIGKTYSGLYIGDPRILYPIPPASYLKFSNPRFVMQDVSPRIFYLPGGELTEVKFMLTDYSFLGIGSYFIYLDPNSTFGFQFFDRFPQNTISSGRGTWTYKLRETPSSTSVPEPGTVFGLSMLGFGWLLRKKKASSDA